MGYTTIEPEKPFEELFLKEFDQYPQKVEEYKLVPYKSDKLFKEEAIIYAAIRMQNGFVIGTVVKYGRTDDEVYWKTFTEDSGPVHTDCPLSIINKLSDSKKMFSDNYSINNSIAWRRYCTMSIK